MATKMAVAAFLITFIAHVEKQPLHASMLQPFLWLEETYSQCGLFLRPKSTTLLISRTLSTQQ